MICLYLLACLLNIASEINMFKPKGWKMYQVSLYIKECHGYINALKFLQVENKESDQLI